MTQIQLKFSYFVIFLSFFCELKGESIQSMFTKPETAVVPFGWISTQTIEECSTNLTSSTDYTTHNVTSAVECVSMCLHAVLCRSSSYEGWSGQCLLFYVQLLAGFCVNGSEPSVYEKVHASCFIFSQLFVFSFVCRLEAASRIRVRILELVTLYWVVILAVVGELTPD